MPTRATPQPNREPDPSESISQQKTAYLSGIPTRAPTGAPTPGHTTNPPHGDSGAFGAPARPTVPLAWEDIDTQPMAAREILEERARLLARWATSHEQRAQALWQQARTIETTIQTMEAYASQLEVDYQKACGWIVTPPGILPPLTPPQQNWWHKAHQSKPNLESSLLEMRQALARTREQHADVVERARKHDIYAQQLRRDAQTTGEVQW